MAAATLTAKRQVTIPKTVRDHLGIDRGDRVEFAVDESGAVRLRPLRKSVRALAGLFADPDRRAATVREMDESVAELLADDDDRIRNSVRRASTPMSWFGT